jgi:iron complex transport system ATP-binding protein
MSQIEEKPALIEMEKVSVQRGEKIALDALSLTIGVGEHVAILGPNGCGKSTLIRTINREFYPLQRAETKMRLHGRETWNVWQLRPLLGIVSNDMAAACTRDFSGLDIVMSGFFSAIGIWPHHEVLPDMQAKAREVLRRLQAEHLAERYTMEMSSGEVRRVLIGRALVHDPKTLLLDEPSTSLDLYAQHELREILRRLAAEGTGIVLVTHHLADIIPEVKRVVLMSGGRIVADGPKREVLTEQALGDLFGLPVRISEMNGYYHLLS